MKETQKEQISHSLVFVAMMLLVTALGIGGQLGIVVSFVAILLTAGAVGVGLIKSHRTSPEDRGK